MICIVTNLNAITGACKPSNVTRPTRTDRNYLFLDNLDQQQLHATQRLAGLALFQVFQPQELRCMRVKYLSVSCSPLQTSVEK